MNALEHGHIYFFYRPKLYRADVHSLNVSCSSSAGTPCVVLEDADLDLAVRGAVGSPPRGLVLPPHVFVGATNEMSIAASELFGPVVPIIKVRGDEEALRVANATEYGLSAAVFTRDLQRGARFAQRVHAGMTHVNDSPVNDLPNCPFGGEKNSGIGRYNGEWSIDEFSTVHWISVQHEPLAYPF
jgi:aldehyde dehydrogenase (NAD+)